MHVLDDPAGLSPRARAFLRRAATRDPEPARPPFDLRRVPDRSGRLIAPPAELTIRREGFAARFGGLRYDVRRSVRIGDEWFDNVRRWQFELLDGVRAERTGWSFAWRGQLVAAPVAHLVHTDGRFGVSGGGPFLEVNPSIYHLIEGHALMDELHDWESLPTGSLEPEVPGEAIGPRLAELLDGLPAVAEASGPCDRWWRSDDLAVRRFHGWTDGRPRRVGVMAWRRTRSTSGSMPLRATASTASSA